MKLTALSCLCADVFHGTDIIRPGGEALNFAMNAARHFPQMEIALIGAVGDDAYGRAILNDLASTAIDISCVFIDPGHPTANNMTYLTPEGDRYYKPDSWTDGAHGAFRRLRAQDAAQILSSDGVFLNIYCPLFEEVLALRKQHAFKLAVDFDTMNDPARFEDLAPFVDYFLISHKSGAEAFLAELSRRAPGFFNVSLAENGSVTYLRGEATRCPAAKAERVVDTTGAGDSYHAGFVCTHLCGGSVAEAMQAGSCIAAEVIQTYGGYESGTTQTTVVLPV